MHSSLITYSKMSICSRANMPNIWQTIGRTVQITSRYQFSHSGTRSRSSSSVSSKLASSDSDIVISEHDRDTDDIRDVSGLTRKLRNRLQANNKPFEAPDRESDRWKFFPRNDFIKRQRKIFAKYGNNSGIDPGVCWPSKDELADIIETDRICEQNLKDSWRELEAKKRERIEAIKTKEAEIDSNLQKMPGFIDAYRKRLQSVINEENEQLKKQNKLKEEMLDHFGFNIDSKDPRYRDFKAKRSEEERDEKKKSSKQARELKIKAKLEGNKNQLKSSDKHTEDDDDDDDNYDDDNDNTSKTT